MLKMCFDQSNIWIKVIQQFNSCYNFPWFDIY